MRRLQISWSTSGTSSGQDRAPMFPSSAELRVSPVATVIGYSHTTQTGLEVRPSSTPTHRQASQKQIAELISFHSFHGE